jgi:hypothetical protein
MGQGWHVIGGADIDSAGLGRIIASIAANIDLRFIAGCSGERLLIISLNPLPPLIERRAHFI